jgi:iron complex transport system substrate-binding protein
MKLFLFSIFTFLLTACSPSSKSKEEKVQNSLKYAKQFELILLDSSEFKLHIFNPETHVIESKYYLRNNKSKELVGYTPIQTPIKSITVLSGTHIGMLAAINQTGIINGINNQVYLHNSSVRKRFEKGEIYEIPDVNQIPIEKIILAKTQILMYSGFGKPLPHQNILAQKGVICFPNYDWRENHPLGKAEWIKLFGALTGSYIQSTKYFQDVEANYKDLKQLASKVKKQPEVFSGDLLGDIWYGPAGESYNALLFKDANTNYIYKESKGTGSIKHNLEEMILNCKHVEFWLNPNAIDKKNLLANNPKYKIFEAFQNNKVYSYTNSGQYFWEMSAIEPHHMLSDLIKIFHPELLPEQNLYFYQKLH